MTKSPMVRAESVPRSLRTLQIITALVYCLLSVGICFGFAALKPILVDSGVYRHFCDQDDPEVPCVDQEIQLNQMFTWAAVATNVSSFPIGLLLDKYGPRFTSIMGGLLMLLGTAGMSIASEKIDIYISSYAILAMSGSFLLLSSFSLATAFPARAGLIVSGMTGAFDASSGIFLIYRLVYQQMTKITVSSFFRVYLIVPILILVVQIWYMPAQPYIGEGMRRDSFAAGASAPTPVSTDYATNIGEDPTEETALLRKPVIDMSFDPVVGQMHHVTIGGILKSGWFIFPALVMITSLIRVNFYISTVWTQTNALLGRDAAGRLMDFFDVLLPVGGLFAIPAIGFILDNYTTIPVYGMTLTLSLLSGLLCFVPNFYVQIAHFLTFVVLRPWIYSILPGTVIKIFGSDRFGSIYGLIMAVAGLFNLLSHPLETATYVYLDGDFVPAEIGLVVLSITSIAGTVLYMKWKTASEREEDEAYAVQD